ncbi:MAG: hypothetical protein U1E76_14250 [Planctomycetota bacterium]
MVIGDILFKHSGAVYTTPIQRVVDGATFYVNVLQVGGTTSGTLNVDIEHRDEIDDSWSTNASFTGITAAGLNSKAATGLKDLVRLKLSQTNGTTDSWMRFAVLEPAWS